MLHGWQPRGLGFSGTGFALVPELICTLSRMFPCVMHTLLYCGEEVDEGVKMIVSGYCTFWKTGFIAVAGLLILRMPRLGANRWPQWKGSVG